MSSYLSTVLSIIMCGQNILWEGQSTKVLYLKFPFSNPRSSVFLGYTNWNETRGGSRREVGGRGGGGGLQPLVLLPVPGENERSHALSRYALSIIPTNYPGNSGNTGNDCPSGIPDILRRSVVYEYLALRSLPARPRARHNN